MRKQSIALALCLQCAVAGAYAQTNPEQFATTITGADLKTHLTIVAGAEMEGRETATEGQKKAAAYLENYFKTLGLKPGNNGSYQQLFYLMEDTVLSCNLQVGKTSYELGKDFMVSARIDATRNIQSKKLVFAGYGISDAKYDDYKDLDVKDAIVVIGLGEPKEGDKYIISGTNRTSEWTYPGISRKMKVAFDKGAVGILLVSPKLVTIDAKAANAQRKAGPYFPSKETEDLFTLNYATVSHNLFKEVFGAAYADTAIAKLNRSATFTATEAKTIKEKVVFDYNENHTAKSNSSNVLAVLEGTDKKDEYVFITAHYDHLGKRGDVIYYGADDDGSGTVAVLEMAEAFVKAKAAGNAPRRSIVFMTVSGEEKGLWGSEYYADHPVFPLDKTTVDLNIDMVGRIDTERKTADSLNYVYVIGHDKLSSDLPIINEGVNNKYTQLVLDYKYDDPNDQNRIYYRSDHYNFARKGVPILFFYDGMLKADYHKPTDTVDKIYWDVFEKRVRMIFYTAWEMANRNEMLKRDIPLPTGSR